VQVTAKWLAPASSLQPADQPEQESEPAENQLTESKNNKGGWRRGRRGFKWIHSEQKRARREKSNQGRSLLACINLEEVAYRKLYLELDQKTNKPNQPSRKSVVL